jgi:hypothetical protein
MLRWHAPKGETLSRNRKTMKDTKKVFIGIVIILFGVVLGYYLERHEKKVQPTPFENKNSQNDSTPRVDTAKASAEIGVKPEVNPKNGSIKIVEEFIKSKAKNPATFEFLEWSELSKESGYWKIKCKYKGVSSFNAEVTTTAWFYIQNNKVVYEKVMSKI